MASSIPAVIKPAEWIEELSDEIRRERHSWLAAGYFDEYIPTDEIESQHIAEFLDRVRQFGEDHELDEDSPMFLIWVRQMIASLRSLQESAGLEFVYHKSAAALKEGLSKEIREYEQILERLTISSDVIVMPRIAA